ncbi:hypothetical protein [Aquitalea sp.]|uniref:hypothetical protein n=1 Tax=Aquitalea sp. TaxID=1872623 RepID=UPI00258E7F96|nr:hypothetical protein [Aquitalea sp.]
MEFKSLYENANFCIDRFKLIIRWTASSKQRVLGVLLAIGFFLISIELGGPLYLLYQSEAEAKAHMERLNEKSKMAEYELTLDAIDACLKSKINEPLLHEWYCRSASEQYRRLNAPRLPARVNEVIEKHAYLAMHIDVKHYIRSMEVSSIINEPETANEKIIKVITSKTFLAGWVIFSISIVFSFLSLMKKKGG